MKHSAMIWRILDLNQLSTNSASSNNTFSRRNYMALSLKQKNQKWTSIFLLRELPLNDEFPTDLLCHQMVKDENFQQRIVKNAKYVPTTCLRFVLVVCVQSIIFDIYILRICKSQFSHLLKFRDALKILFSASWTSFEISGLIFFALSHWIMA